MLCRRHRHRITPLFDYNQVSSTPSWCVKKGEGMGQGFPRLLGDIGGTYARFALETGTGQIEHVASLR